MELLYLYWICLPLRRLPGGLWLPNLTFSVCYGALSLETLWASEVRFTYTKYLNSILTFASQELRAFIDTDLSVNQVCHNIKFFILFIFSFGISAEVNISPKISISAQPLKMALHRNPAMHGSRMVIFLHDSKKALF